MSDGLYPSSTSSQAARKAAHSVGQWRSRILQRLEEQPSTLFEIAAHYEVPDHVISGRFSELERDGYIERTGDRRAKPQSGCEADVWRLRRIEPGGEGDMLSRLGYPPAARIGNEIYDRQQLLAKESYFGIPYARRSDTGTNRYIERIILVECPKCGKPLSIVGEDERGKKYQCTRCRAGFRVRAVNEAGRAPLLAFVMEAF